MKEKQPTKDQKRREFIKKSTIVGAGVPQPPWRVPRRLPMSVHTDAVKPEQKGYQLTQHVLDYYKSADI